MTWDADLGPLDRKLGRAVTVNDWKIAGEKAWRHPETLTDDDLLILKAFAGAERADPARALRTKALAPPPALPEPSPAPQTKTAAVNTDKDRRPVTVARLKKIFDARDEEIAEAIATVIKAALTPVFERLAGLERETANAQALGLGAQVSGLGKQVEELKSEVNYLNWARQHEAVK
jgi:hypothetical protein